MTNKYRKTSNEYVPSGRTLAWPPHARAFPRALVAMEQLRELIREEVSFEITSYDFVSVISFILACIIVKLVVVVKVMKG